MSLNKVFFIVNIAFLLSTISCICNVPNCQSCSISDKNTCAVCIDKFFLLNDQCVCRENSCLSCNSSYDGDCAQCKNGFELKHNRCYCKLPGCKYCNSNGCDQCYPGFRLERSKCVYDSSTIISCNDSNCQYCSDSTEGSCSQCKAGYNLHMGKCNANPLCLKRNFFNLCILCPAGYYPVGEECEKNCLGQDCPYEGCDNKCLLCENNHLYQYTACSPTKYCNDINCENCFTANGGDCFRCNIGYRLYQGQCFRCSDLHCLACDYDTNQCSSCQEGFYLVDGSCKSFDTTSVDCNVDNCQTCNAYNYCKKCYDSYSMTNGQCVQCNNLNCESCIDDNKCFICKNGFRNNNGNCESITCKLKHCLSCSSDYKCAQCEEGHQLIEGRCQMNLCGVEHCSNCNTDAYSCSQCDYNYYLTDTGKCHHCVMSNCKLCTDQVCLNCNLGYKLSMDNRCYMASHVDAIIPNCLLYKQDGSCQKCERNCVLKTTGRCKCISYIAVIIGVVSAMVIIAVIIGCFFVYRMVYRRKTLQYLNGIARVSNQNQQEQLKDINSQKISEEEMNKITQNDLLIPKCFLCKTESAVIQLSCGCFLCLDQGKVFMVSFEENFNEKSKDNIKENLLCPVCKTQISSVKQVYNQCGICLDITTKTFNFNCNCAMKVCSKCYNKCLETAEKCPGCRKDFFEPQTILNPNNPVPLEEPHSIANRSSIMINNNNELYTNVNTNCVNNNYLQSISNQILGEVNHEINIQTNAIPGQLVETRLSFFH